MPMGYSRIMKLDKVGVILLVQEDVEVSAPRRINSMKKLIKM